MSSAQRGRGGLGLTRATFGRVLPPGCAVGQEQSLLCIPEGTACPGALTPTGGSCTKCPVGYISLSSLKNGDSPSTPSCTHPQTGVCSRHTSSDPSIPCEAGPRPGQPALSSCHYNHGERCPKTIEQHQFAPGHWGFAVVTLQQQRWD